MKIKSETQTKTPLAGLSQRGERKWDMQDVTAKLKACEASLKRWHSRLGRASRMVTKLERQRRRLQSQMGPVGLTDLIGKAPAKPEPQPVSPAPAADIDTTIPAAFRRSADVDVMKAERLKREAADKKKMPLTGKAAMAAIMSVPVKPKTKRKPVTA